MPNRPSDGGTVHVIKMLMLKTSLVLMMSWLALGSLLPLTTAAGVNDGTGWKLYTNARFGFSLRYPDEWRLGNPMPDGVGVTFSPPIEHSLVAVSGHMNVVSGTNQDGRQTLEEFATAHRRIITELYGKKAITVTWRKDEDLSLAGFPAKRLSFTYLDEKKGEMIEHHIFSLGRNDGRGIRVKVPTSSEAPLMSAVMKMLDTYRPGRDQDAVSPFKSPSDQPPSAPR